MIKLLLTIAAAILTYVSQQNAEAAGHAKAALSWVNQARDAVDRARAARERVHDTPEPDEHDPYRRD